jgi:hypothetical protein
MWRIIFSIILGFIFPILYFVILAVIGDYIPQGLTTSNFHGRSAPGILLAPLTLPALHKNSKERIGESSIVNRKSKYRLFDKVVARFLLTIDD